MSPNIIGDHGHAPSNASTHSLPQQSSAATSAIIICQPELKKNSKQLQLLAKSLHQKILPAIASYADTLQRD
jgi:hypothetical protein